MEKVTINGVLAVIETPWTGDETDPQRPGQATVVQRILLVAGQRIASRRAYQIHHGPFGTATEGVSGHIGMKGACQYAAPSEILSKETTLINMRVDSVKPSPVALTLLKWMVGNVAESQIQQLQPPLNSVQVHLMRGVFSFAATPKAAANPVECRVLRPFACPGRTQ